jgi:hypothetical protein
VSEKTHTGYDVSGYFSTDHRGEREDCPAPECLSVTYENRVELARSLQLPRDWGVWCRHAKHIIVRDPDNTDSEGYPVGKAADPWPCPEPECSLEAFEEAELQAFEDSLPGYYERHGE